MRREEGVGRGGKRREEGGEGKEGGVETREGEREGRGKDPLILAYTP